MLFRIPHINPLHLTDMHMENVPQYNSKHIYDWPHPDTLYYWQTGMDWAQPWQLSDNLRLQITSETAPIVATLMDEYMQPVATRAFVQKRRNEFAPSWYIYELDWELATFAEGYYYLVVEFGSPVKRRLVSNKMVFAEKHPDTLLVKYSHPRVYGDAYFKTGFSPEIRFYGTLDYDRPGSKNTLYTNQDFDQVMLSSKPYNIWRLYVGDSFGVPNFFVPKMNWILGCQQLLIEGRAYTKAADGSQLEKVEEVDYALRGWSMELMDRFNRASGYFDAVIGALPNPDPDGDGDPTNNPTVPGSGEQRSTVRVVIAVENKGFVEDDLTGGSFSTILDAGE